MGSNPEGAERAIRLWTTQTTVIGLLDEVLALLTEPDAIERWTPAPFELIDLNTDRLVAGSRTRPRGRLARHTLEFDVEVVAANDERLALAATGPISIDVAYALRPAATGSQLCVSVSVHGRGLLGPARPRDRRAPRRRRPRPCRQSDRASLKSALAN